MFRSYRWLELSLTSTHTQFLSYTHLFRLGLMSFRTCLHNKEQSSSIMSLIVDHLNIVYSVYFITFCYHYSVFLFHVLICIVKL